MNDAIRGMKGAESRRFSLSIVNTSLGETGLHAGRGGLAILLHFNLSDGGGEQHQFVHALTCYDSGLDRTILHNTIWTFLRRVTRGRRFPDRPIDCCFTAYRATNNREEAFRVLEDYLRQIDPFESAPSRDPSRVLILESGGLWPDVLDVTSTSETWEEVIQGLAAIGAALYASVLPWAALTTSVVLPREREGLIIRFLARPRFMKQENPLVILEDLDSERAAVALLPVIEKEIPQVQPAPAYEFSGIVLSKPINEEIEDLPTDAVEIHYPPPPMLLEDPDTDTAAEEPEPDELMDAYAVSGDFMGEPELTENVVLLSPAVARPLHRPAQVIAPQPSRARRWPLVVAAIALLVPALRMLVWPGEVEQDASASLAEASDAIDSDAAMEVSEDDPAAMVTQPAAALASLDSRTAEGTAATPSGSVDSLVRQEMMTQAWVSSEGNAPGVWLKQEPAGQPVFLASRESFKPGVYVVIAQFSPQGTARDTTRVTLSPGEDVRINCDARTGNCRVWR